jgi:hypothetical protein
MAPHAISSSSNAIIAPALPLNQAKTWAKPTSVLLHADVYMFKRENQKDAPKLIAIFATQNC